MLAIYAFGYFGPARINLLLEYFKSFKKVWRAKKKDFVEIGIKPAKVEEFDAYRRGFDFVNYFKKLKSLKIKFTTTISSNYPSALKGLDGSPSVLYYKGKLSCLEGSVVAIVGSRKMTSYGKAVATRFSSELAAFGVTVISGLARGIDSVAHHAAMSINGKTAAVLGCGLDSIYPSENSHLAESIIQTGGILISEYPLGYPALPVNFAARNRIISGLSSAVLVVEGAEKSGTLLTAAHAADQGKTVFAVPGQITSPLSFAPLFLIKSGAKMATDTKDVLKELDLQVKVDRQRVEKIIPSTNDKSTILKILENEALHLDELVRILGFPTSEISARLTIMEMKGLVRNLGKGIYEKL